MNITIAIRRHRRRAIAAAELAIVLPLVLLFLVATVDLARFAALRLTLCRASHLAATYGATRQYTAHDATAWRTNIVQLARDEVARNSNMNVALLHTEAQVITSSDSLHHVVVTCHYPFVPCLHWPGIATSIPLTASTSIRRYR